MPGPTPILIGVIGGSEAEPAELKLAYDVGSQIAARGWWLICGGLGGVMAEACRGAREAGGHTIGILPGTEPDAANPWVEIPIATGLADARNVLIARSAAACIAVGGSFGTLSEIAFCLKFGRPVVAVGSRWANATLLPELELCLSPALACARIAELIA